jgi:sortase A
MPDRRSVDDLSVEELERILAVKKRAERARRVRRMASRGRLAYADSPEAEQGPIAWQALPDGQSVIDERYRAVDIEDPAAAPRFGFSLDWRWLGNKVLLLIEVLAVAGLAYLGLELFWQIDETNQEAATIQVTLTPTVRPLIDVVVLPGGHRPPNASGNVEYLDPLEEIPEHLRGLVQPVTPLPIPTPGPGQPTRLVIPAIRVDAPVIEGDTPEHLKKGVGHHQGTANPGQRGNMVMSAHNDIYGGIFRNLDQLEPGDELVVYSGSQTFRYVVTQRRIVEPTEVSVMYPTSDPTTTLVSCYPYMVDNKRIVVMAELQP